MSLFGRSTQDEQSVLLCTIESGAAHATLCLMHPRSKPFLVHSVSKQIAFQEQLDFDRFASATLQALADACQEIVTKGLPHVSSRRVRRGRIDAVYCTYGSPWYVSQTRRVDVDFPKPIVFTRERFNELVAQHGASRIPLSLAEHNDGATVIEQNVVDIRLNGYPVHNPYGKETSRVSFSVLAGAISHSFSKYTEDIVGRFFSADRIMHHAGASTLFLGIRDTLATDGSFLCVDVSGELTDVSVAVDGVLSDTVSFPYGVRTAMRAFSRRAKVLQTEVLGIMQGIRDATIDRPKAATLESSASAVKAEWQSAFAKALVPVLAETPLPKKAFLAGDSGEFSRIKNILLPVTLSNPQTTDPIDTTLVTAEQFSPFCIVREGVRLGHPLVPLSALHVHRLLTMKNKNSQ